MNDQYEMSTFKTDTAKLWFAGTNVLPTMADKYSDISTSVWKTRGLSDGAFSRADSPSGKLPGIYAEWDRLRSSFQDILSRTSTNLVGTGNALRTMAEDMSGTDGQGAAEIAAAGAELEPVEVSTPKSSTDAEPPPPEDRQRQGGDDY